MQLKILPNNFSICKLNDTSEIFFYDEFVFIGKTDEEISLVCSTENVPDNFVKCDRGWRGFRIQGELDFSLTGILSKISKILADNNIGIFAVSTYNTDYIFVREENLKPAVQALNDEGYSFEEAL